MQQDQIKHGFKVVGMEADGKPSIFVHSFFPDQIVNVEPLSSTGSTITVKYNEQDDPCTWNVILSVVEIEAYIKECRRLDSEAASVASYGALKDGK